MLRRKFRLQDNASPAEGSLEGKQEFNVTQRNEHRKRLREMLGLLTHESKGDKITRYKQKPDSTRDQFGNRIFHSTKYWYFDNEYNERIAELLISTEGKKMIQAHRGILHDIERGMLIMMTERQTGSLQNKKRAELGDNRRMSLVSQGGQSLVYLLEIGDKKYIIKRKAALASGLANVSQPYINEMLQCQTLAHELKTELERSKISLVPFMFASGKTSCVEFIEGAHPSEEELMSALTKNNLLHKLVTFLEVKRTTDPVWKNIQFDLLNNLEQKLKTDNFIKRVDGSLVWIDPFYYLEN